MDKDSIQKLTAYQGKKIYRLKLKIAVVKPEPKPLPNYWDENEPESVMKKMG